MSTLTARARGTVETAGDFFLFVAQIGLWTPRRPFAAAEMTRQAWIIMRVIIVPTALVSIPLGAVVALQIGSLTQQLGAQSFAGAASVVAIVREGAPLATSLLLAGASGSAICADFGAGRSARRSTRSGSSASTSSSAWWCRGSSRRCSSGRSSPGW